MCKVVGVIVTYNRKALLLENIKMQEKQYRKVDDLVIIDNHSDDGSREYIENQYDTGKWIHYIYMPENTGGAGGFYYGMKYAYEMKADYIWLMDDDGRPFNEFTLKNLLEAADSLKERNNKLLLNALVTVDGRNLSFGFFLNKTIDAQTRWIEQLRSEQKYIEGIANPFNGTLLSRETIETVGYVKKEFFILRDEVDYFRRCEDADVLIATILNAIYIHPASKLRSKRIGKHNVVVYENIEKEYYANRNTIYGYKYTHKMRAILWGLRAALIIICLEDRKKKRLGLLKDAVLDALGNRMGRWNGSA